MPSTRRSRRLQELNDHNKQPEAQADDDIELEDAPDAKRRKVDTRRRSSRLVHEEEDNVPAKPSRSSGSADAAEHRIAEILDRHDNKVRLLFHLEQYVSLVSFDPEAAKKDQTQVFENYRHNFDLWNKLADTGASGKRLARAMRHKIKLVQEEASPTPAPLPKEPPKPKVSSSKSKKSRRSVARKPEPELKEESWVQEEVDWDSPDLDRSKVIIHPSQLPSRQYGGLEQYLSSFVSLDDDVSAEQREEYVDSQVDLRRRIDEARRENSLIFDTKEDISKKFVDPIPGINGSFHMNLVRQAIHFSDLMRAERRNHAAQAKKLAKRVLDERKRRLEEKNEKSAAAKAKKKKVPSLAEVTGKMVLGKWELVAKVVAQRRARELEEQRREHGKKQLDKMLENTAKLLERRVGGDRGESESEEEEVVSDVDQSAEEADSDNSSSDGLDSDEMSSSGDEDEEDEVNGTTGTGDDDDSKLSLEQLREKYAALEKMDLDEKNDADDDNDNSEQADESKLTSEQEQEDEEVKSRVESEVDDSVKEEADESVMTNGTDESRFINNVDISTIKQDSDGELGSSDEDIPLDSEEESESELSDSEEEEQEEANDGLASLFGKQTAEDDEDDEAFVSAAEEVSPKEEDGSDVEDKLENGKDSKEVSTAPHIPSPFLLKGTLREYQHDGLDWLAGLYNSHTNGILADEMGLGKTIQTIALLSYLACEKHVWGPHLIVVPTSVMLNWEMEFKRFAPGFKVLTYYGNPQQRKEKRKGWNKEDVWHVCITSYQLVLQDQPAFRRKKWHYMILDEAHNIKNFQSQRWQALLNFNSERRLLLTGTPLQNNLIELWSLLYFLMPSSKGNAMMPEGFANLKDFQDWFARPVDKMVEEGTGVADEGENSDEARQTVSKLHQILRPYLLRRLKIDVEKQMPAKYEHIVYCRLSKRQRYLYDDFMSRAQTRETLASGNYLSIINCLMQLRKVCNHPDLFEVRPIVTSFAQTLSVPGRFEPTDILVRRRLLDRVDEMVDLNVMGLLPAANEHFSTHNVATRLQLTAYGIFMKQLEELTKTDRAEPDFSSMDKHNKYMDYCDRVVTESRLKHLAFRTSMQMRQRPMYGRNVVELLTIRGSKRDAWEQFDAMKELRVSYTRRSEKMGHIIEKYAFVTPKVVTLDMKQVSGIERVMEEAPEETQGALRRDPTYHLAQMKMSIAFPDKRLVQFDCGKLQRLALLLRELTDNGHRALIFTQMTKVLDILETFLNIHGYRYLRLDGATRVEQRQVLTERFNTDARIPVFILSTRSGGLGINLTGADTVIFYDNDWNPAMDRQCQDRCHRIGQTRDVHIYRFVSEYTIESNILRKATQKRVLDNVVIQEGDFTTDYLNKMSVKDVLGDIEGVSDDRPLLGGGGRLEKVLAQAEDQDDVAAAKVAMKEVNLDTEEFTGRNTPGASATPDPATASATPQQDTPQNESDEDADEEDEDDGIGHIDDYMLRFLESDLRPDWMANYVY